MSTLKHPNFESTKPPKIRREDVRPAIPKDHEIRSFNGLLFPTKYVVPKSFLAGWPLAESGEG